MKILVDARSLGEKPSGVGIYLYKFVEFFVKKGYDIVLLTDIAKSEQILELKQRGIVIYELGYKCSKQWKVIRYFYFIQKIINKIKPDIFWEPNNLIPIKLKNPYGKIFVTIHDIFPCTHKRYYPKLYSLYFYIALKMTMSVVDGILYDSKEVKSNVENRYKKAKNIGGFISYIIVDRVEYKGDNSKNYFFYVGNCEKRKGTDILLKAYLQYLKLGGKKKLYIAGNIRDKYINKLIKRIKKITPKFKYLGYLTQEEKERYLLECSGFVFPSMAEGFGIPILEAMNYNKRILASNLPIFLELFSDSIYYSPIIGCNNNVVIELAQSLYEFDNMKQEQYKIEYAKICKQFEEDVLGNRLLEYWMKEVE